MCANINYFRPRVVVVSNIVICELGVGKLPEDFPTEIFPLAVASAIPFHHPLPWLPQTARPPGRGGGVIGDS